MLSLWQPACCVQFIIYLLHHEHGIVTPHFKFKQITLSRGMLEVCCF